MILEAREVRLKSKDRLALEARVRSPLTAQRDVKRARIVLLAAEGRSTRSIAKEVGVQPRVVSDWRNRFADEGLEGLEERPRPGKKPIYGAATDKRILKLLDRPAPKGYARWTGPLLAEALGDVDVQHVWRFLRAQKIDLAGRKSWCESNDPQFTAKAADVIGLYADPEARIAKLGPLPAAFDPSGAHDAKRMINNMVTDYFIGEQDREIARWHVKAGAPTYRYYFSYLPSARRTPDSLGVPHGGEIGYVFGRPAADPQDAATTAAIQAYWLAFAKTGDPGSAGGPRWPRYDLAAEAVMEFSSDGPLVRNHLFDARYDWVRGHRTAIAETADPGVAPLMNANPAHEGPRRWVIPSARPGAVH